MQSKIRVYESGRTEQVMRCFSFLMYASVLVSCSFNPLYVDKETSGEVFHLLLVSFQEYDPDLPPELAAAAGIHDIPSGNANLSKMDAGQSDASKASTRARPPLVCGRS